ncbi:CGNR zinc finger domain-containing protein [Neobacillus sp. PS3-34]|uniref:CGNR zinc finger domain-containing protein n=1 Tax=Neobacillus sp. PS3-34 TaxID=3070678 RepID=UPI0027DF9B29|nr:CGNR zinc finger domain-containing protein [Neobacillus sp. PS3-34]WML48365.1 CGNR zinc finger domain-containing protein [Neobacillus sp. PS3-34]
MENTREVNVILSFLNTWEIPNMERIPKDHLLTVSDVKNFVYEYLENDKNIDGLKDVIELRTQIRNAIEQNDGELINNWIKKRDIQFKIKTNDTKQVFEVDFGFNHNSLVDNILVIVLNLILQGTFHRIKICPDCKWVFYDQSKSGTKKWCNMNATSSDGRACGTISKVKRYREKNKL